MSEIIIPASKDEYKYLVGPDSFAYELISESKDAATRIKFRSISGRSNCRNGNKRVYTRQVLDNAFIEFLDKHVKSRTGLGEIEHPTREKDVYKVPMDFAALKVLNVFKSDDDLDTWWGDFSPTTFARGEIITGMLRDEIAFGVSTRGFGKYMDPRTKEDVIEYHIKAIDAVVDPSTPGAMAQSIRESAERIMESRSFYFDQLTGDFVEASYDKLKYIARNGSDARIMDATKAFIDSLQGKRR